MKKEIEVKILDKRLFDKGNYPDYQTEGSAGIDLRAMIERKLIVKKNSTELIKTGIAVNMKDKNMAATILPRSGMGHKNGIVLGNLVGLIDSDYQGEIKISCWNRSDKDFTIEPGDRIAQIVFVPIIQVKLKEVSSFEETERGAMGFGYTGVN